MRSFVKIKPSQNGKITLSFTDIVNHALVAFFFYVANMTSNAIRENNFSRKLPNLQLAFSLWFQVLQSHQQQSNVQSLNSGVLFSRID